ncbi:hypothetical protein BXT84_14110 [Sulfobacillus thermotolerans]|uniref:Helix-turn-helix domain-containing protein n=1 Tax=Sulfobacillus thermotolerans TaxID=338644 RepID=A0ABM6RU17_9FIRM|nr:hypothetical protein BXT84_14110 [Sulfobacillus thermotolerans]
MNQITPINRNDKSTWPEILSVKDVCYILSTSRNTVYDLIAIGHLHSLPSMGKIHRITKDSLLAFLQAKNPYNPPVPLKKFTGGR